MLRPVAVVLLAAITASSVGCQAYMVGTADRENLRLATTVVKNGIAEIEGSKKATPDLPEAQDLIIILDAREAKLSTAFAQEKLSAAEGEAHARTLPRTAIGTPNWSRTSSQMASTTNSRAVRRSMEGCKHRQSGWGTISAGSTSVSVSS